ncbi:MAG: hypothetical protein ABSE73_15300 [Planctomycetota bacterium]
MVISNAPSKVAIGRGSRWPIYVLLAVTILAVAFLVGYWSWLVQFRQQLLAVFLVTALSAAVLLVILRVVAVAFLVGAMVRTLLTPARAEDKSGLPPEK